MVSRRRGERENGGMGEGVNDAEIRVFGKTRLGVREVVAVRLV